MFLLVSVRHVRAHPGEHQHGVSIQISISLGKTFLRISGRRDIPLTWILARVFVYVPPFIPQILDFIYWTVLILILIHFEWSDTENQQYLSLKRDSNVEKWTHFFFYLTNFLVCYHHLAAAYKLMQTTHCWKSWIRPKCLHHFRFYIHRDCNSLIQILQ